MFIFIKTFNIFFEDLNNKDITTNFDSFKNQIACLSNHVNEIFWKFIDEQIDVYAKEPLSPDHPYMQLKDYYDKDGHCIKDKLLMTPHIAWTSDEALETLVRKIAENIEKEL